MNWDSCVLWLEKAMQGSKWIDQSKYNNNGAMTGAAFKENAIEFDGVDDLVNCGQHSSLNIRDHISVEVLIKPYSLGVGNYGRIMEKVDSIYMFMATVNLVRFQLQDSGANNHSILSDVGSIPFNEWTHVVGTYDGTTQKIYTNGVQCVDTDVWTNTIKDSAAVDLSVGNRAAGDRAFDGPISLVRIYKSALTAQQVKECFEQTYRKV
ncbi:MAG: LamG domain-containing protein [Methanosarcinales archaeon]